MRTRTSLLWATCLLGVLGSGVGWTQTAPKVDAPTSPEVVASIKPNKDANAQNSVRVLPGSFTGTDIYVHQLITLAYELQRLQLVDAPSWTLDEHFDIV